jgi:hypothetical protein
MTTNENGLTRSATAARIDAQCARIVARPDYAANMRAAQQAVAAQLRTRP